MLSDTHPRPGVTATGTTRIDTGPPDRFEPTVVVNGQTATGLARLGLVTLHPPHPGASRTVRLTAAGEDIGLRLTPLPGDDAAETATSDDPPPGPRDHAGGRRGGRRRTLAHQGPRVKDHLS